ncbi:TolC family protein [Piscinibacter sp. HJYY11]|uniref:TolC family protein n=1 Tax=Piscinibacter sp. HJYY11 TaxID=2801333 RepID=UPI00191D3444|nr:TolC family protein [Piscinibacter sp. HJYY11]MBL0727349.1 TolC family protein [Piscinibacter sp. HJYY11]
MIKPTVQQLLPAFAAVLALLAVMPADANCIDESAAEARTDATPIEGAGGSDPRENLHNLVREALRRSQAIGAAKLLAEAAAIDVKETRATRFPTVNVGGTIGSTRSEVGGVEEARGKQGRGTFSVTVPIFDGGRISDLTDWRESLAEAARFGHINAQEQVALQTVSLAIERSRYHQQAQVYQQYARKMSCLVEALQTIVRADRGRQSELVQAQKNQKQAEVSYAQTLSTVRQVETRLRRFVGEQLPANPVVPVTLMSVPNLPDVLAQAEGAPDIAQLTAQAEASKAFAESVKAQRWPQVSATVSGSEVRGVGNSGTWSAGINVSMPIFNAPVGHAVDSSRKRAEAARLQRADALESKRSRMTEVHDQAMSSFDRARRVVEVLRDSERLRNFTLQQWQQLGRRSLFDVMASEGDHYNLRVSYVNALYDGQQSNALLWSLGLGVQAQLK